MDELSEAAGTESVSESSPSMSSILSSSSSPSSCYSSDGDEKRVDHLLPHINSNRWRHVDSAKYSFRRTSLISRNKVERGGAEPTERKFRRRPRSLSRYTRKRATTRERRRMHEMNRAFEALRKAVPQDPQLLSCCNREDADKSSKIKTLRLALKYITQLRILLGYEDSAAEAAQTFSSPSEPNTSLHSFSTCSSSSTLSSMSAESVFLPSGVSAVIAAELSCDSTDLHNNDSQASNAKQSEHFSSSSSPSSSSSSSSSPSSSSSSPADKTKDDYKFLIGSL